MVDPEINIQAMLEIAVAIAIAIPVLRYFAIIVTVMARGRRSKCPKCYARRTRHAVVFLIDRPMPAFISPRRCENCKARYYSAHSVNYATGAKSPVRFTMAHPTLASSILPSS